MRAFILLFCSVYGLWISGMPLEVVERLKIVDEGVAGGCRELCAQFGVESGSMTGTLFGSLGQLHYLTSATVSREFGQLGVP